MIVEILFYPTLREKYYLVLWNAPEGLKTLVNGIVSV